ncbi:MAG: 4-hydroxy-tetrahydrodipicolinate synthase [Tissierellales bacterium]|nr:4-hydroxy-tetrahydrodipicolinate synthase [Tissierellales bacterium]
MEVKKMIFKGAGTALVTPFENGEVNFKKYGELIDMQIENGIDAIITCGTTGEGSALSDVEHKQIMEYCVKKVAGRVPVIAGTGSNDTEYGLQLSQAACKIGVDGLMMVTPYYNKTTQRGLINHYTYIADRVDRPIILYNVPSRTGMSIDVDTAVELSKHRNIVAIKDATGDIGYTADLLSRVDEDFNVYSGNDNMILPVLSLGGIGVISVISNIMPRETHEMVDEFLKGNIKGAKKIQLEMISLINSLFIEVNPIPVKTAKEEAFK